MRSSEKQAEYFSNWAKNLNFSVHEGKSNAIRYPTDSPYDERLGYSKLPDFIEKLSNKNFQISNQARSSSEMLNVIDSGFSLSTMKKHKLD